MNMIVRTSDRDDFESAVPSDTAHVRPERRSITDELSATLGRKDAMNEIQNVRP